MTTWMTIFVRKFLLLSTEEHKDIAAIVGKCAARTNSLLRHLPIAPGSSDAFQAYVAALHQMYYMGAAHTAKAYGLSHDKNIVLTLFCLRL